MGGGHGGTPVPKVPKPPEPEYVKLLANRSHFCPPGYFYNREIWYPSGGPYSDPKGWRQRTFVLWLSSVGLMAWAFQWSLQYEHRWRPPKGWVPSLLWNPNCPNPVDFRGRILDRNGNIVEGAEKWTDYKPPF